jgi:hypothetical protein
MVFLEDWAAFDFGNGVQIYYRWRPVEMYDLGIPGKDFHLV